MKRISVYLRLLKKYLYFFWKAKTIYNVHSPFVATLAKALLEDQRNFYVFGQVITLRERLLMDQSEIAVTDLGAGSMISPENPRTIASIARLSAIPSYVGKLLFRLVQFKKPRTIIELGTSLGISAIYQSAAALNSKIITLEGCPELAKKSKENFRSLGIKNITLLEGSFRSTLPEVLKEVGELEYLFMDGDHRRNATLEYFEWVLPYLSNDSIIVIADIHWSDEMEKAWEELASRQEVSLSIDLFHLGLLFFRKEHRIKEHYRLIPSRFKIWRLGLVPVNSLDPPNA